MAKKTAIVFGIIFLIAGIWGLFSASVLGLFAFGTVASIIHIIVGIVLLAMAGKSAVSALKTVGILYVIFFILALLGVSFLGNSASGWLYLVLGVVIAILGFSEKKGGMTSAAPQM